MKRELMITRALGTVSALLLVALVGALSTLESVRHNISSDSFYGTSMLGESAGGYILVAVITFIIAVVITVLCIRLRDKKKKDDTFGMISFCSIGPVIIVLIL